MIPQLSKNVIFRWFWFPQVVQKQTLEKVKWSFNGQLSQKYSCKKITI